VWNFVKAAAAASVGGGESTQLSPPPRERGDTSVSRLPYIKAHIPERLMLGLLLAALHHSFELCPDHTSRLDSAGSSISE